MFNPPGSPLSSAATASPASVYRTTDEGGIVHGAVVRGSRGGKRKQQPAAQRQARMPEWGSGDVEGEESAAGSTRTQEAFPSQAADAGGGGAGSSGTAATRRDHPDFPPESGGYGMPSSGRRTPLESQQPASHRRGRRRQERAREKQDLAASGAGSVHRPETVDNQRVSPPLGQVSVSWGQAPEVDETAGERAVTQFTACATPSVVVPSYTRGGRGAHDLLQGDLGGGWSAGNEDFESRTSGGGGSGYEPLSKGPDYRKVGLEGMKREAEPILYLLRLNRQ